jgi:hypothetical protein
MNKYPNPQIDLRSSWSACFDSDITEFDYVTEGETHIPFVLYLPLLLTPSSD